MRSSPRTPSRRVTQRDDERPTQRALGHEQEHRQAGEGVWARLEGDRVGETVGLEAGLVPGLLHPFPVEIGSERRRIGLVALGRAENPTVARVPDPARRVADRRIPRNLLPRREQVAQAGTAGEPFRDVSEYRAAAGEHLVAEREGLARLPGLDRRLRVPRPAR